MKKYAVCTPNRALTTLLLALLAASFPAAGGLSVKGAYYYYGSGFPPSNIKGNFFTHILYAFAKMDTSTCMVKPRSDDGGQIESFSAIVRKKNPFVKTLLSIAGGGSDAYVFSTMVSNRSSRLAFIRSSISLARQNGFDGLDLDWEFPQSDTDMANLGTLFFEWRKAVIAENKTCPLLLTAAVKINVTVLNGGAGKYPVQAIDKCLDWINIMSYDYHGAWDPTQTGEHTALYEADPSAEMNTNYGITQWLGAGLPPAKVVMGLAMYGRNWLLKDASDHGVGAPAISAGPTTTVGAGVYTYDEVRQFVRNRNATCEDDAITKSAYCYGDTEGGVLWVGYDDKHTVDIKVKYDSKKLRGYFFWSLGSDKKAECFSTQRSVHCNMLCCASFSSK